MYKIILSLLIVSFFFSCDDANKKTKKKYNHYLSIYNNALNHGDINVAINACYEIIGFDSTKTNFYDTLVYLYLNTNNEGATFLAARSSLKYNPNNDKMTRVAANFAKSLGMADTAIAYYKRTFVINNNLENLYDMAQVQYNAGYDAAAEQTADMIIKSPDSEKTMIAISLGKETPQQIPMKAAAYNIKGTILISLGSKEVALKYFDEALKIAPDFRVAKKNKEDILTGKIKFEKQ